MMGNWELRIELHWIVDDGCESDYVWCCEWWKKTGTVWTAVAHIVTGVIGSGVLSLAWSIAQLGWIGGPLTIIFFACITLLSAFLLSNTYRGPDPEHGPHRSSSYLDAVNLHKGNLQYSAFTIFCFFLVFLFSCWCLLLSASDDTWLCEKVEAIMGQDLFYWYFATEKKNFYTFLHSIRWM